MIIFCVNLQMLGELRDAFREDGNLHFRRAGVGLMGAVRVNDSGFLILSDHFVKSFLYREILFTKFLLFPESEYRAEKEPEYCPALSRN